MILQVARLLFPFSLAVGAAIWAKSYHDIGDGFSAGAVTGLGAIAQYVCLEPSEAEQLVAAWMAPYVMSIGLILSLSVVLVPPLLFDVPVVSHYPLAEAPQLGVLKVHTAAAFDLGIWLLVHGAIVVTFKGLFPASMENL